MLLVDLNSGGTLKKRHELSLTGIHWPKMTGRTVST